MYQRYRKAIAAFILPFLGLPIFQWVTGDLAFDGTLLQGAIGSAILGVVVYFVPNAQVPDFLATNGAPTDGWGNEPPPVTG